MNTSTTINRRQRRATGQAHHNNNNNNGIAFQTLFKRAHDNSVERLRDYGNGLSKDHVEALGFEAAVFTVKAQGIKNALGRHQITLAPGMGKSEMVVSWLLALHQCGYDHVGVTVATTQVAELINLIDKLVKGGFPADRIGLWHAKRCPEEVSRPSEGHDRQVLFCTHERIRQASPSRGGSDPDKREGVLRTVLRYEGRPRFVIYDEALMKAQSAAVEIGKLKVALSDLIDGYSVRRGNNTVRQHATDYLESVIPQLDEAMVDAERYGRDQLIQLTPVLSERDANTLIKSLPDKLARRGAVVTLLEMVGETVRVRGSGNTRGCIQFEIVLPRELKNVVVLDASYPIRHLSLVDRQLVDATEDRRLTKLVAKSELSGKLDRPWNLSAIKLYDQVTIYQMRIPSGRRATEDWFSKGRERVDDNLVVKEVVNVVTNHVRPDESVLVFTFKDKKKNDNFVDQIEDALRTAGVDLDETVEVPGLKNEPPQVRKRIIVATWGQETALNDFSHCHHVIAAGVLRRSRLDLAGAFLGQAYEDLKGSVTAGDVSRSDLGEVCHVLYQALNRGRCRVTAGGDGRRDLQRECRAQAMTGWIIYDHLNIRDPLSSVMTGLVWKKWPVKFVTTLDDGKTGKVRDAIAAYMRANPTEPCKGRSSSNSATSGLKDALPSEPCKGRSSSNRTTTGEIRRVGVKTLRKALQMAKDQKHAVADQTWKEGRQLADKELEGEWRFTGQSYVEEHGARYGFADESA